MKLIAKRLLFVLGILLSLPLIILTLAEGLVSRRRSERLHDFAKEILSVVPTIFGAYARLGYYWAVCTDVSCDAYIKLGSVLAHRDTILRSGASIGGYNIVGYADVGENVITGARVSLLSGKYQHGRPGQRMRNDSAIEEYHKITIGRNSWIGDGAIVMADVGENCTIGAGSVISRVVPDNAIFMGNPARKVNLDSNIDSGDAK